MLKPRQRRKPGPCLSIGRARALERRIHSWAAVFCLAGGLALLRVSPARGEDAASAGIEFFEKRIRPVLVERCYECHSAARNAAKGGLQLDSRDALRHGGDNGPAILHDDPEKSLLIRAVRYAHKDLQMPPKHRLDPGQVANLVAWVRMGAPDPRDKTSPIPKGRSPAHWAFQPLKEPPVPAVRNRRLARTPVDNFLLARLARQSLKFSPRAEPRALVRRLHYDLIGLPPSPEETDAFVEAASRDPQSAISSLVERLLASPHYGERWGRHWLDVVRYADTAGDSADYPVPQAGKFRDYVIDSFNRDKPYDQFLGEQIAGDLLPWDTETERRERIIATGFIALSRRFGTEPTNALHLTLEDTLDTLGKSALGLSLSCARCHDHKHDPVTTQDYYALYGIFSSTRYPHAGSEDRRRPSDFVALHGPKEAETLLGPHRERLATLDRELKALERQVKAVQARFDEAAEAGGDTAAVSAELRRFIRQRGEKRKQRDALAENPPDVEDAYAVTDARPGNARLQKRGEPWNLGDEIPRGFIQALGGGQLPKDCRGSGRLELARWIASPTNPLTARVMVNRIWQHHFGRGLVATPNDFGTHGQPPSHPELLDWLACEFIQSGWSVKAMHRLMLRSAAWQQSSGVESSSGNSAALHGGRAFELDPDNRLLWKFQSRRLDAEQLRDSLLVLSGDLDRTPGGAHPFPPVSRWEFTQHSPFTAVYESKHRSVYLMQQRIQRHPFLAAFDGADPNASTAERGSSITPLQALFAMNDAFAHDQAAKFGVRILRAAAHDRERIDLACRLALGRPARREEIVSGEAYLRRFREKLANLDLPRETQATEAWASYARALLAGNEFMFLE